MLCKGITVLVEISMTKDSSEGSQNATLNLSGKQIPSWGQSNEDGSKKIECAKIQNQETRAHAARA